MYFIKFYGHLSNLIHCWMKKEKAPGFTAGSPLL